MSFFDKKRSSNLNKLQKVFLFLVITFCSQNIIAQEVTDSIFYSMVTKAIVSIDANALIKLVHTKVDITIFGQSGIYSKNQSKFILESFLKNHKPDSFNIVSKNRIENSSYFVGKMYTANQQYRVCFLTKKIENKIFIYQIRIEE